METSRFVLVDADNTLWDTNAVFAAAQIQLLDAVRQEIRAPMVRDPLAFVRAVDQAIAERHHHGLRYPPRLLARGVADALGGRDITSAARQALRSHQSARPEFERAIETAFLRDLAASPALRDGVLEGLEHLRAQALPVVVLSESTRDKIVATATALGIEGYLARVFEGRKRLRLFARFAALAAPGPPPFVIGDQLDRDIAPARAAGLPTVYFPGGFKPKWSPEIASVQPDFTVTHFLEAARIVTDDRASG